MADVIIDKAWSNVGPYDKVRFALPQGVRYGVVKSRKDHSIVLYLVGLDKPKVLPDGRWYFVQGKMDPDAPEHLVVIEELPDEGWRPLPQDHILSESANISVNEAVELVKMDGKQLRRYIRRGVVVASKDDQGQWRINRDHFLTQASKYGWV